MCAKQLTLEDLDRLWKTRTERLVEELGLSPCAAETKMLADDKLAKCEKALAEAIAQRDAMIAAGADMKIALWNRRNRAKEPEHDYLTGLINRWDAVANADREAEKDAPDGRVLV